MNDCTDPANGHLWKKVLNSETGKSVMVICLRDGCHEIGYQIHEYEHE